MKNPYLISTEFNIAAEPYPAVLAGLPYETQVDQTGVAYYPRLLASSAHLPRVLELIQFSLEDETPFLPLDRVVNKPFRASSWMMNISTTLVQAGSFIERQPFTKLLSEGIRLLKDKAYFDGRIPRAVFTQTFIEGDGISRHVDSSHAFVDKLMIVSLNSGRVTELITPDGRLLAIPSQPGDVLLLPQAGGDQRDRRVEHAVGLASNALVADTVHLIAIGESIVPQQAARQYIKNNATEHPSYQADDGWPRWNAARAQLLNRSRPA